MLLNSCLTLADGLYIYSSLPLVASLRSNVGILKISNQPVEGSIIFMKVRLEFLRMIALPGCCCLIDLLYVPIRYELVYWIVMNNKSSELTRLD